MPTNDFLDSLHVAHNALCAFGPIGSTIIAFNVLESLLQQLSRPRSAAGNISSFIKLLTPLAKSISCTLPP
jgi:hypothetical protein